MQPAQATWLPDGRRLHLHHGPIDMIVDATGPGRNAALARAAARFNTLLAELAAELPRLRASDGPSPDRETARRMTHAIAPFAPIFVTPMAAVAGAGAETILAALCDGPGVDKAYVNNGGDVAIYLGLGQHMQAAIATTGDTIRIGMDRPVRGIATFGAGGRSHSLGIADSVTVLAATAARADAAATLLANAVDLPDHPAIARSPACDLSPDSDLGDHPVTISVGPLTPSDIDTALAAGAALARDFIRHGLIQAAHFTLQGKALTTGDLPFLKEKDTQYA